jgi:hypothetical protein
VNDSRRRAHGNDSARHLPSQLVGFKHAAFGVFLRLQVAHFDFRLLCFGCCWKQSEKLERTGSREEAVESWRKADKLLKMLLEKYPNWNRAEVTHCIKQTEKL